MPQKVSVILPVYNRSASLEEACRSVLNQSYRDLELIVVDDASTEDLKPIIEAIDDPRLRYIRHEKNGGAGVARNTGLAAAKHDLIAFQDSDDLWLPGKLARQVALLNDQPAEVGVVSGAKIAYGADGDGGYGPGLVTYAPAPERRLRLEDNQLTRTLLENRLSVQTALFRRNCYSGEVWFDTIARANEDWDFAVRLLQETKIYEDIEPVLLAYSSPDGVSGSLTRQITGHIRVLKKNRHLSAQYPKVYARSQYTLGRLLSKTGRRRTGRKFMLQGIRDCPEVLWYLVQRSVYLARRKVTSLWRRRST